MNTKHALVILSVLSMMLPMVLQPSQLAAAQQDRKHGTMIELDFIDECVTTLTCNAEIFTGTTITFSGTLTTAEGKVLDDMPVDIIALVPKPELVLLASGITDDFGVFEAEWVAKLSGQETVFQNTLSQFRTESLTVFAQFAGDDVYASSKSNKLTASLTVNTVNTIINSDKNTYEEGDTVVVFIAFVDSADSFVDPDRIFATMNTEPIELERKKEGSYTFTIEQVPRIHTQILVVPEKAGYNLVTAYLTIIIGGLR